MVHLHGIRTAWPRIHAAAYRIWLVLVTVKVAIIVAMLACILFVKLVIGDAHARTSVRESSSQVLPGALLALLLLLPGCSFRPVEDTSADQSVTNEIAPDAAQQQTAYAECITRTLNDAVLKSQNVQATLDSMIGQTLNGCPTDFTQGFIDLRQAVRDYAQTLAVIEANNRDRDPAVNRDLVNFGCSLFTGQQCAPSSIQTWIDVNETLKARDAENRATIQSRYDALEKIAAGYGVTISTPAVAPPSEAVTNAM